MQKISADTILSDFILINPSLLPVVYLTGISSDFDTKTIHQVCKDKAINESYLLNLLMVITQERFVPTETLPSYSVLQLTALSTAIYPYFMDRLDVLAAELLKQLKSFKKGAFEEGKSTYANSLKPLFAEYRHLLAERFELQKKTVLPHMATVYELYYSPDYTSEQSDSLTYSLEFYDGKIAMIQRSFENIKYLLEQTLQLDQADLKYATGVFSFYQLNKNIQAQDRIEQKLLKPLVLQMEESILTTFRKKNRTLRRNNFLSLPIDTQAPDVLTHREKEVLKLVAKGLMNKEIADKLQIGLTTVISHRKNLVEKLGIKTIPGLTVYAYTQGYLDDTDFTNETFQ